jgi:integrase
MASINERGGNLFFDFRYRSHRCREYTALAATQVNRRKLEVILKRIETEIDAGTFEYRRYFPDSKLAARFDAGVSLTPARQTPDDADQGPLFSVFVEQWLSTKTVEWRQSYAESVRHILQRHLLPAFGDRSVVAIDRGALLTYRAQLATERSPRGKVRSAATVNRIMGILSMILDEVALEHGVNNPLTAVKRLKVKKTDIEPFSLEEVRRLIDEVRADFQDYLIVRFFTGMRSGEIHGLKWRFVDFDRREICVRETLVNGREEYTKTDGSQREIQMSQPVFDALRRMQDRTGDGVYVFQTSNGLPIDTHNFTNRIWNPLLDRLGLKRRRPYQTRHTAATLWLAAGENPEWIARQMGHTSTQMLFSVYSRYIANLTRQDGSAFDRLIRGTMPLGGTPHEQ